LSAAAEIAWTHHERWDGLGYPRKLAGKDIPFAGRIAALADSFDALTTARPYRTGRPVAVAAELLRAERARQFDPFVLDAFLDSLAEAEAILQRFPDDDFTLAAGGQYVTLQVAARTLDVSPTQLRRWSDEGRLAAIRTRGGHRRFRLAEVRRLADEL